MITRGRGFYSFQIDVIKRVVFYDKQEKHLGGCPYLAHSSAFQAYLSFTQEMGMGTLVQVRTLLVKKKQVEIFLY